MVHKYWSVVFIFCQSNTAHLIIRFMIYKGSAVWIWKALVPWAGNSAVSLKARSLIVPKMQQLPDTLLPVFTPLWSICLLLYEIWMSIQSSNLVSVSLWVLQHFQKVIPHQFDSCPDKLILRAYQVKYNPKRMKKYEHLLLNYQLAWRRMDGLHVALEHLYFCLTKAEVFTAVHAHVWCLDVCLYCDECLVQREGTLHFCPDLNVFFCLFFFTV